MNISDVEMRIAEAEEGITAVKDELAGVEMALKKQKKQLAQTLYANRDKAKKPASLNTQKRSVGATTAEVEGLQAVIETLENDLESLEIEKTVVELHQGQGKRFLESLKVCERESEKLGELSQVLQSALRDFSSGVSTLIESTATARQGYAQILQSLPTTFSLQAFLQGKLERAEDLDGETEDRAMLVESVNSQLLDLSRIPDPAEEGDISAFVESTQKLSKWKKFIVTSDVFERSAFTFRTPRPLTQTREPKSPMQPAERYRYILANQSRFDDLAIAEAKRGIAAEVARSKAARETPRQAKTRQVGGIHGG